MKRALSPTEVLNIKHKTLDLSGAWEAAFGTPERCGIWFVWGNSGNGKTSFLMQLCKELTKFGKVAYNSLEEGASLTMQNTLRRYNMAEVNRRFLLIPGESIEDMSARLSKRKSPDFVVIDSVQYAQINYKQYIQLKEAHPNKLIIIVSHAEGNQPAGRSAKRIMYDASLKIWVEGYRAFSKGRFIGSVGHFDIWAEGANRYWGDAV